MDKETWRWECPLSATDRMIATLRLALIPSSNCYHIGKELFISWRVSAIVSCQDCTTPNILELMGIESALWAHSSLSLTFMYGSFGPVRHASHLPNIGVSAFSRLEPKTRQVMEKTVDGLCQLRTRPEYI